MRGKGTSILYLQHDDASKERHFVGGKWLINMITTTELNCAHNSLPFSYTLVGTLFLFSNLNSYLKRLSWIPNMATLIVIV